MANKRMFSKNIIGTDDFIEMTPSTRALYFELGMYADDDGFVTPRGIMRMYGHTEDDIRMLIAKNFVIPFKSGVVVIKHWKANNLIRGDRYVATQFVEEKSLLSLDECGNYIDTPAMHTDGIPMVGIGKDRLGKVRLDKTSTNAVVDTPAPSKAKRFSSLKDITPLVVEEIADQYGLLPSQVRTRLEDMRLYCSSKGRRYANYKAALMNWLRRDIQEGKLERLTIR